MSLWKVCVERGLGWQREPKACGSHWNHQLTKSAPLVDSLSSTQPTAPWALPGSPMNGLPSPSAVWYAVP